MKELNRVLCSINVALIYSLKMNYGRNVSQTFNSKNLANMQKRNKCTFFCCNFTTEKVVKLKENWREISNPPLHW